MAFAGPFHGGSYGLHRKTEKDSTSERIALDRKDQILEGPWNFVGEPMKNIFSWVLLQILSIRMFKDLRALVLVNLKLHWVILKESQASVE